MIRRSIPLVMVLGCSAAEVELGQGVSGFEPLADGDTLTPVEGLQGGFHLNLAARVPTTPETVALAVDIVDVETGTVLGVESGDGPLVFPNFRIFPDESTGGGMALGVTGFVHTARLVADETDDIKAGYVLCDARELDVTMRAAPAETDRWGEPDSARISVTFDAAGQERHCSDDTDTDTDVDTDTDTDTDTDVDTDTDTDT